MHFKALSSFLLCSTWIIFDNTLLWQVLLNVILGLKKSRGITNIIYRKVVIIIHEQHDNVDFNYITDKVNRSKRLRVCFFFCWFFCLFGWVFFRYLIFMFSWNNIIAGNWNKRLWIMNSITFSCCSWQMLTSICVPDFYIKDSKDGRMSTMSAFLVLKLNLTSRGSPVCELRLSVIQHSFVCLWLIKKIPDEVGKYRNYSQAR